MTHAHELPDSSPTVPVEFENIVQSIPHMVWVAGPDGSGVYHNHQFEAFTGLSNETLRGQGWTQAIHSDDRARIAAAWTRAAQTGQDYSGTLRVRRHDGEYRWCSAQASPLCDENGNIVRWIGTWTDIHDRITAEQQARDSDRVYRAIGEAIPYGVWVCEPDGRNIYASESFLNLVGLTQEECSEFGWGKVLHPEDAERTIAAWKECVRTGGTWDIEHRFRGVDGKWHPVLARGVPVKNDHGEVLCWAGINLDISRLKEAEEALRQSEERLRALADSMPQLAWTARPDGFITWYNRRWYEYTGTTPEKMKGWGWTAVHAPDTLPDVVRHWEAAIASGHPFEMEFPLRGADASYRRFLTRAFPLKDSEGKVIQWFGTNTDVTDIIEAQEALREADRRKDEFLAVLSHELRNPLAPIRNSVALLRRAAPASEQALRAIEVIDRQSGQLTKLVDDLLDLSRIAQGKVRLDKQKVVLNEVVRHAVEDHRALFAKKGVALEVRDDAGEVWVEADAHRLSQVVGNLLQNAAKYTKAGGHVTVSLGRGEARATVRVRDDGMGIDRALLGRLFQPFVQADTTLDRTQGGLGLGLAVAKNIIALHQGTIEASSLGLGQGAEFTVTLPLAAGREGRPAAERRQAGRHLRIVLIEDLLDAAETLRDVLTLDGHHVALAHTGPEGVTLALEQRPDVVLCDLGLPGCDGLEVARRLRAAGLHARLVALTGYAAPEDVERARIAGFDDHLAKPPDLKKLAAVLASTPRA